MFLSAVVSVLLPPCTAISLILANKLLIDDRLTYVNQFEAAGGKGFKYFESGGIRSFGGREASVGPVSLLACHHTQI